jgi:casein kinase II subunit beta
MLFMVYPQMVPSKGGDGLSVAGGSSARAKDGEREGREGRDRMVDKATPASGVGTASTANAAMKAERYRPRIFGFHVNEIAKLQRWQDAVRDR